MKEIQLTQDKVAIVDDENFEWLSHWKWTFSERKNNGYAIRRKHRRYAKAIYIYMHRLIMNAEQGEEVDHINRDGLDNRKENLRFCSHGQNGMNQGLQTRIKSSKFKGVTHPKGRKSWCAQLNYKGKHIYLGSYKLETEAALAYNKKAKEVFGKFAKLNQLGELCE